MLALRQFAYAVSDLLWPRRCHLCAAPLAEEPAPDCFCPACLVALSADPHESCPRCAATVGPHTDISDGCPACREAKFPFDAAVRLGPYDGRLREAILRAKQPGGEGIAETLGRVWATARREQLLALRADVVVPVPLHWRRRWERGFNPAGAVARGVADILRLPLRPFAVRRVRPTPKQTGMSRAARLRNVSEAFSPFCPLPNLRILLTDDVLTTGATVTAVSQTLFAAGAAQVSVAVLARR